MQKVSVLQPTAGPAKSPRLKHPLRSPSSMAKVPSLLFELEMDHGEDAPCVDEHDSHPSLSAISTLLRPTSEFHQQVRRDVHIGMQQSNSIAALSDDLSSLGYSAVLHTNHEGDTSVSCLQSLPHSFIVCTGVSGGRQREPLIVDPYFRDQFEMAKATPSYTRFMDALPQVLVSTEAQLRQLVKILCREMHEAFVKHGASIPPWRGKESLLSKWRLPRLVHLDRPGSLQRDCAVGALQPSFLPEVGNNKGMAIVACANSSVCQVGKGAMRGTATSRQLQGTGLPAIQQQCCGARS